MVVLEIMEPLGVEEIGQELSIKDGQTATVHSQSQLANLGWQPEFSVTASILR